jgi:branched-chain amino acid transport system permease protein
MELIWDQIALAGAIALVAFGFTLLYSVARFINFAHQSTISVSAYACYWAHMILGLGILPSIGIALGIATLFGILEYCLVFRPFIGRPAHLLVVTSFGISLIVESGLAMIFGTANKSLGIKDPLVGINGVSFYLRDIYVWCALIVIIPVIVLYLRRARFGLLAQAIPVNMRQVRIWGLSVHPPMILVFGLSALLAGLAGVYLGVGWSVFPGMGLKWGIWAFSVAIIGGLGSLYGSLLGAAVVTLPVLIAYRFGGAVMADGILFLFTAGVLLVRPQGLFPLRMRRI